MKIKNLLLPFISMLFFSCDDALCDHIISDQPDSSFVGLWYDESNNEEFRVFENGTFYDKFSNTLLSEETEGQWSYDKENKRFTETYEYTGQVRFVDWTIVEMSEFRFVIQSDVNGKQSLSKIIESYEMAAGSEQQILFHVLYPEYHILSYSSTNNRIASVTDDGLISANGAKGTAYIKIETVNFDVWVKVLVGDDCLDLWYNYEKLLGHNYKDVNSMLGTPSVSGDDGYSFGWPLTIHQVVSQVEVYLNPKDGLANMIVIVLKDDFPQSVILSYLESHFYSHPEYGGTIYSDNSKVATSSVCLKYDMNNGYILMYTPSYFSLPDYSDKFSYSLQQIIDEFGDLYYDMPFYVIDNYLVSTAYFYIDDTTDRVWAFTLFLTENATETLVHSLLSEKLNNLKVIDGEYGYYNADNIAQATYCAAYDPANSTITYFNLAR